MIEKQYRPRVFHLQHYVYPYRFPLFEELASRLSLDVYFCRDKRRGREWNTQIPTDRAFGGKILHAVALGPLTFNPGLLWALRKRYDAYSVASLDAVTLLQFLQVYAVAKLRGAPFFLVDEFINTLYYRKKKRLAYAVNRALRRLLYPRIDAFVLWNKAGAEWAKTLGARVDRIFYGPQVLPKAWQHFWPSEKERERLADVHRGAERTILFVGRLIELKGAHVLLRAFKLLKGEDLRLVIVGNGPWESRLRQLAGDDSRVVFRGYLDGEEKRAEFGKADIFVLPSLHEPWGLVVNEALAWGLPIIATEAVGSRDYLVRSNGYVIPPNDSDALLQALQRLLDDSALRKQCRAASIELSERFQIADMARPFIHAIACLVGEWE